MKNETNNPFKKNAEYISMLALFAPKDMKETLQRQVDNFEELAELLEYYRQKKLTDAQKSRVQLIMENLPDSVKELISNFTR